MNNYTQLIRAARFPALKELADVDFSCLPQLSKPQVLELAHGEYIQKAEPILMLGNPGLGKTPLAIGLALAACRPGYKVRFYTASALVNELIQAQDDHRLPWILTTALKQHMSVADELGCIPFSFSGAHLMLPFCSSLYERVALIVTTNLRFADWTQVVGDERLTAALLDRGTYGTLLVDLERHRPLALLPDRTADTLAAWLRAHPGVTISSRDRSTEYARGATLGAPAAPHVLDRWHLVRNLREALERLLDRLHPRLAALSPVSQVATAPELPIDARATPRVTQRSAHSTRKASRSGTGPGSST